MSTTLLNENYIISQAKHPRAIPAADLRKAMQRRSTQIPSAKKPHRTDEVMEDGGVEKKEERKEETERVENGVGAPSSVRRELRRAINISAQELGSGLGQGKQKPSVVAVFGTR